MADVFVSYSRKDKDFIKRLHQALAQAEREAWIDWKDIPLTADWWLEIQEGIEAANTFVFVISPDSITSAVCHQEVEHAIKHNKRIVPLLHRESGGIDGVLGRLNWIYFREYDDFDHAFTNLLTTMDTDLEWVKVHTRLTRRAVEWNKKERNESYLLRGDNLSEAEWWQAHVDKSPALTQLQQDYILASRQKQDSDRERELAQARALAETERQRAEEQRRYAAQLRRRGLAIIGALVGIILLGFWSYISLSQVITYRTGTESLITTISQEGDAHANSDICRVGAIYQLPEEVLPACNRAVELEPDNWYHYESRGVVQHFLDNHTAARADFMRAVTLAEQSGGAINEVPIWQTWIVKLDKKENPLDSEAMHKLRQRWENPMEIQH